MRSLFIYIMLLAGVAILPSCKSYPSLTKDIKHMDIRFRPLTRADYKLVGNLQAESTISGAVSKKGTALDAKYANDYKKGLITKTEKTEILYFAPAAGQAITGSLYENDIFNSVYGPASTAGNSGGLLKGFIKKFANVVPSKPDPGMDFAYFEMVKKYPEIDYFINVRFDRKLVYKGKSFTETIIVKADGIKLKTD